MVPGLYKWLILPLFTAGAFFGLKNINKLEACPDEYIGIGSLPTGQAGWRLDGRSKEILPAPVLHPFYVCVTEINHNTTDKSLEITCKIFADDFDKVLGKKYKAKIDFVKPVDKAGLDNIIYSYIKENLSLKSNGSAVSYSYLGYEKEDDAVYCYMEIKNVSEVKKLDIIDSMLHDLNDQQINIIHVTVNGNRKSTKLDFPAKTASFSF